MKNDYIKLTPRERYAMAALQGILANPAHNHHNLMGVNTAESPGWIAQTEAAKNAVYYADALIVELNKPRITIKHTNVDDDPIPEDYHIK